MCFTPFAVAKPHTHTCSGSKQIILNDSLHYEREVTPPSPPFLCLFSSAVEFFGLNELNEISTTFAFVFCSCDDFQFFNALTFIYLVWWGV